MTTIPTAMFSMGQLVATPKAASLLNETGTQVVDLMARYLACDWGDISLGNKVANDQAVENGNERIVASYLVGDGRRVYISTEADRSTTTILLPEEY